MEEKLETPESTEEVAQNDTQQQAAPKRKHGKAKIIGIVAAIVVVVGCGFWAWHETPGFCGAICHTPMDAYYDTYANGQTDKLGNQLDDAGRSSMLSYAHKSYAGGIGCMGCHKPVISQQVSEGMNWVSGNYVAEGTNSKGQTYLASRSVQDLADGIGVSEEQFCMNERCHVATGSREALAEKTKYLGSEYNPHIQRHGEIDCSACHKAHTQSVNYCTECHATAPVPEGWLTMQEAREKGIVK